jgi:hypothetical protein
MQLHAGIFLFLFLLDSYFLWDSYITALTIRTNGVGFVIHGVSCFLVFLFSFVQLHRILTPFLETISSILWGVLFTFRIIDSFFEYYLVLWYFLNAN